MSATHTMLLALLLYIGAGQAHSSCEQSFDVDPNKTLSSVAVLLAMPEASDKPVSCSAAESYREFLFLNGATKIDDGALDSLESLKDTMKKQRQVFLSAIADAEPNPTRILVDTALLEYGKYATLVACFAPEPTATKIACGIGISSALLGTYDLGNNLVKSGDSLKVAKAGLAALDALYDEIIAKDTATSLPGKARLDLMYTNMCTAIRDSCLKD